MSQNEFVTRFVGEFDAGDSVQKIELVEAALRRLLEMANTPVDTGGSTGEDVLAQIDQLASALETRLSRLPEIIASQIRVTLSAATQVVRTASAETTAPAVGPTGRTEGEQAAVIAAARTAASRGDAAAAVEAQAVAEKTNAERAAEAGVVARQQRAEIDLWREEQILALRNQAAADRRAARAAETAAAKAERESPAGRTAAAETRLGTVTELAGGESDFPRIIADLKNAYGQLAQKVNEELGEHATYIDSQVALKQSQNDLASLEKVALADTQTYLESYAQLRRSTAALAAAHDEEVAATPSTLEAVAAARVAREKVAAGAAQALTPEQVGSLGESQQQRQQVTTQIKGAGLGLDPELLAQMAPEERQQVVYLQQQTDAQRLRVVRLQALLDGDSELAQLNTQAAALQQEINEKRRSEGAGGGGGGGGGRPGFGGAFGEAFNPSNLLQFAAFNLQFTAFNAIQRTLTDAISSAAKLDQQLALIQARAQAIGQGGNFESLRQNIIQVADSTGISADQVATLANEFLGLYDNVDQANQATASAAQLIRVMGVSAATAGPQIAAIAEDFGASVNDIGNNVVDAANKTGRSTADIAAGIAQISPEAQELGLTLDNVRGIVEAVGVSSAKSGQQIGESLARVLPEIQTKLPALAQLGFQFSPAAVSNTKVALEEILKQYGGMSDQVQQAFAAALGGPRQAQIVAALAKNPQKAIDEMNSSVSSNTLLTDANARVQATFAASLTRLRTAATGVGEAFLHSGILQGLTDIISALGELIKIVTPVIDLFARFNADLGGLPIRILAVAAALALISKALEAVRTSGIVSAIIGTVTGAAGGAEGAAAGATGAAAGATGGGLLSRLGGLLGGGGTAAAAGGAAAGAEGAGFLGSAAALAPLALPVVGVAAAVVAGSLIKSDLDKYGKQIDAYRQQVQGDLQKGIQASVDSAVASFEQQVKQGQAQTAPGTTLRPPPPSYWERVAGQVTGKENERQIFDETQNLQDPSKQAALQFAQAVSAAVKARQINTDQLDKTLGGDADSRYNLQQTAIDEVKKALKGQTEGFDKLAQFMPKILADPKLGPVIQDWLTKTQASSQQLAQSKASSDISAQMTAISQNVTNATGVQITSIADVANAYQSGDLDFQTASSLVRRMADSLRSGDLGGTQAGASALAAAQKFLSAQIVASVNDQITFAKSFLGAGPEADVQILTQTLTSQTADLKPTDRTKLAQQLLTAEQATYTKAISEATSIDEINKLLAQGFQVSIEAARAANEAAAAANEPLPFEKLAAQQNAARAALGAPGISVPDAAALAAIPAITPDLTKLPSTEADDQKAAQAAKTLGDQKVAQARLHGASAVQQGQQQVATDQEIVGLYRAAQAAAGADTALGKALEVDINAALTQLATDQVAMAQSVQAQIQAMTQYFQALNRNNPVAAAAAGIAGIRQQIAQSPFGNIGKIQADIKAGTAGPDEIALGTAYVQAGQAAQDAANAIADAQGQFAEDLAKSSGDTVGAARAAVTKLQGNISRLAAQGGANSAAMIGLRDQMLSAQAALRDAQNAVIDAQIQYASDLATAAGDPVKAGQYKIQELRTQIAQLRAKGATTGNSPELLGLLGQLAIAQTDQISTFINTAVQHTQDSLDLRRIGAGQAIANLEATLKAAAAMGANQTQLDALQKQINNIVKTTEGDLNWNIGQIAVPTLYQARRLEATGSSSAYQDNRTQAITINVHNAQDNPGAVNALLDAVGGPSRTGTALPVLSAL